MLSAKEIVSKYSSVYKHWAQIWSQRGKIQPALVVLDDDYDDNYCVGGVDDDLIDWLLLFALKFRILWINIVVLSLTLSLEWADLSLSSPDLPDFIKAAKLDWDSDLEGGRHVARHQRRRQAIGQSRLGLPGWHLPAAHPVQRSWPFSRLMSFIIITLVVVVDYIITFLCFLVMMMMICRNTFA